MGNVMATVSRRKDAPKLRPYQLARASAALPGELRSQPLQSEDRPGLPLIENRPTYAQFWLPAPVIIVTAITTCPLERHCAVGHAEHLAFG